MPPYLNPFCHWSRTYHMSLVTSSQQQLELLTRTWSGRTPWNSAKLGANRRQGNNFFVVCSNIELRQESSNKILNDWPQGKQWVCFPSNLNFTLTTQWSSWNWGWNWSILLITNGAVNIPYPQLPAGFRCECIVGNVDPSWRPHMKSLRMLCRIMIKVMMTQELEKW